MLGFRDLGVFSIPSAGSSDHLEIHNYLTSLFRKSYNKDSASSCTLEALSSLLSTLQVLPPSEALSIPVHLIVISIFSDSSTLLFNGAAPMWKWAKPDAPSWQAKHGLWKPDLGEVVEDAEWNVGPGVRILVKSVSEDRWWN